MDLQLARLETLAAVARHGSFSHAARELHLSQPAVSMQVRQLEQALGVPLLERVGKRAFPTKAGELLLAHAGRALRELETGVEVVQQLRGIVAGRIRLGTSASFSIYLLPPALRARGEHAGAPARAGARRAAPRARRQARLPDEGRRAAARPRGPRVAGARDRRRGRAAAPRNRGRAHPARDERVVLDLPLASGAPSSR